MRAAASGWTRQRSGNTVITSSCASRWKRGDLPKASKSTCQPQRAGFTSLPILHSASDNGPSGAFYLHAIISTLIRRTHWTLCMSDLVTLPAADLALATDYARQALAPATLQAYAADWAEFAAWCQQRGASAVPADPTTVTAYLASIAVSHARSTLRRRLAAIGRAQRMKGIAWAASHPAIRDTLAGIFRCHGTPQRRAAAIGTAELRQLVATCGTDLAGQRDRALLLLGFAGRCGARSWSPCSGSTSPSPPTA
jgi:hypothetical protein